MKKDFHLKKMAIVGLGLMGGSLGLAARKKRVAGIVSGFARRPETRRRALERGVVDEAPARLEDAISDAGLVVFCVPVGSMVDLVKACMPFFSDSCVVTDVGSAKHEIVSSLDPLFKQASAAFVGGHPIAGSEQQGLDSACAGLYEKCVVVLTHTARTDRNALDFLCGFWKKLGARVKLLTPVRHDSLLARTSHAPHIVAAMLSSHVGRSDVNCVRDFCGSGFADTTRIASGDPGLWADIVKSNALPIARELDLFHKRVGAVKEMVRKGEYAALRRFLNSGRERRRKLI